MDAPKARHVQDLVTTLRVLRARVSVMISGTVLQMSWLYFGWRGKCWKVSSSKLSGLRSSRRVHVSLAMSSSTILPLCLRDFPS